MNVDGDVHGHLGFCKGKVQGSYLRANNKFGGLELPKQHFLLFFEPKNVIERNYLGKTNLISLQILNEMLICRWLQAASSSELIFDVQYVKYQYWLQHLDCCGTSRVYHVQTIIFLLA